MISLCIYIDSRIATGGNYIFGMNFQIALNINNALRHGNYSMRIVFTVGRNINVCIIGIDINLRFFTMSFSTFILCINTINCTGFTIPCYR